MEKKKQHKAACPHEQGAADGAMEKADKGAATLADLFLRYRREGWSDGEIEMGLAGQ